MSARVLMVDHRDSFTFNLVDALARCGAAVLTLRADVAPESLALAVAEHRADLVVLSPGPGRPEDAPATVPWLRARHAVPVLGVCLGHQAMAVALGGKVERAPRPVHGKTSIVDLGDDLVFAGLPRAFPAARYHSLVVTGVPAECEVIATARDDGHALVMAMRHRRLPWLGVQFHPESYLTAYGDPLLQRVLEHAIAWRAAHATETNP